MKNWREQLSEYERNYDLKASILLLKSIGEDLKEKDKLDLTVRVMFLITYWFVEGNYTDKEKELGEIVLKEIFVNSLKEFKDSPDYLFCLGVITRLNEYVFNLNLDQPDEFLEQAISLAPERALYKNWVLRRNHQPIIINEDSSFMIEWKEKKGLLGKYVTGYFDK